MLIIHRLGFWHICVDSLCIYQDSAKDWATEARKMAEMHKHATCTISATGAPNGDLGSFSARSSIPGESLAICLDRREDHFSLV